MKKGGGSKKGRAFENHIAKKLSYWWTDGQRDDIFYHSTTSGARATTRMKQNKTTANSAGDLMALDDIGKPLTDNILIEIKRGYTNEISILDLLDSKKKEPILLKWHNKAKKEAKENNIKDVLIIFKRDRKDVCILFDDNLKDKIDNELGYADNWHEIEISIDGYFYATIMKLENFLEYLTPDIVKEMY